MIRRGRFLEQIIAWVFQVVLYFEVQSTDCEVLFYFLYYYSTVVVE